MSAEFRVLGNIEVRINGQVTDVGHHRQQCVLVALLVDADRAVSVDQLLARIWADHPPQRARDVLYGYLSRLRHALAGTQQAVIVRQRDGYRLTADPMTVDMHLFDHLVGCARSAHDSDTAASAFQRALGLWHGRAFPALDTPWINEVRDVLDQRRLTAILDHNDIALGQGRHTALVEGLPGLAAEHSLNERLTGQVMLALYRSGRQGQALQTYDRLRLQLADELGADPSPPLQQLHQRILHSDPALAEHETPAVHAVQAGQAPVPRQLPAAPTSFTGREHELARLNAITGPGSAAVTVTAIVGTGGIGKTWLAVHWAHRNIDDYPDGQLYVNLRGFDPVGEPLASAVAVRAFLDALNVPACSVPIDVQAQIGLYRSLMAGRRMLVVLDNAHNTDQLVPLLPGTATCTVLVTSRSQLAGLVTAHGARPLALDILTEPEARQLLIVQLGPQRVAAEPEPVNALLTACDGLPLALGIVAARAKLDSGLTLSGLADELRHRSTCLDGLDAGELAANLRAVFAGSYNALPPEAAAVFRLLGLCTGPDIALAAAASLAALPVGRARVVLRQLTTASLVHEHAPGRYRMHDLVRLYSAERAAEHESPDSRTAAVRRLLDHYLHTARGAALRLDPQRDFTTPPPCRPDVSPLEIADTDAATAWFTAEHGVLLAAIEQAAASGFDAHVWQLAWSLTTFFDRQGHWNDRAATQLAALASAERLGDRWAQAQSRRGLAVAYTWLARYADARTHIRVARDLFAELDDNIWVAHSYRTHARVWAQQGRHDEALAHDQRALALYEKLGHRAGRATALNAVGWHLAHLGGQWRALSLCRQALALYQELGDSHGEANTWDSLGYIQHQAGDHQQALDCYQHALRLYHETNDRYQQAVTLDQLGDTQLAAAQPHLASDAWQQALDVLAALGHPRAEKIRTKLRHLAVAVAVAVDRPRAA